MAAVKLTKAPLKEVIFELHWKLKEEQGLIYDPGFDLAQGIFAEKIKSEFPVYKKMYPDNFPLNIVDAPIHQYWKKELTLPVVQHGKGMIAVNDNDVNYDWETSFRPMITNAIDSVIQAYKQPLQINRLKLQYVDAWDLENESFSDFLDKKLQTKLSTQYPLPGALKNINIQQSFELHDKSLFTIVITNGINNQTGLNSVITTLAVEKQGNFDKEAVLSWVESAHTHTSSHFKQMLNKDYYANLI